MTIKQDETKPVAPEIMAQSILDIADAMRALQRSRLNRKAIVALIHDHSKVAKKTIEIVLNNLELLDAIWLKKK